MHARSKRKKKQNFPFPFNFILLNLEDFGVKYLNTMLLKLYSVDTDLEMLRETHSFTSPHRETDPSITGPTTQATIFLHTHTSNFPLFTMVTRASTLNFPTSKIGNELKEMNVFPMN